MAITEKPLSVSFTATNDAVSFPFPRMVVGMTFYGTTGLTAGQVVVVRNRGTVGAGSKIGEYTTETTGPENADLWAGRVPQRVNELSLDNTTVGGTWVLTVFFGDLVEPA